MGAQEIRFHPVIAALYDPVQAFFEHVQAPAHRERLARGVSGRVLEIGLGTGAMLPYFAEHAGSPLELHGVEPDPLVRRQASEKLDDLDVEMTLVEGRAEALPYADGSFDVVVESGVLCSVADVDAALDEVARVLAPGGEFRFFDHVRSPGLIGRTQDALTPAWRRMGGNCHLNREIGDAIAAASGFRLAELERETVGYWPVREFVRGTARPVGM